MSGLPVQDGEAGGFNVRAATEEEALQLRQRGMPYFGGAPTQNNDDASDLFEDTNHSLLKVEAQNAYEQLLLSQHRP